jgi:hypothetical protein
MLLPVVIPSGRPLARLFFSEPTKPRNDIIAQDKLTAAKENGSQSLAVAAAQSQPDALAEPGKPENPD